MAQVCVWSSPSASLLFATAGKPVRNYRAILPPKCSGITSSFKSGSQSLVLRTLNQRKPECKAISISVRCEQSTKESNGLDVWLGRLAMVGFATAITVEITTGRGLLENFGVTEPLPTLALVVTALVGALTTFFIFQSASQD